MANDKFKLLSVIRRRKYDYKIYSCLETLEDKVLIKSGNVGCGSIVRDKDNMLFRCHVSMHPIFYATNIADAIQMAESLPFN